MKRELSLRKERGKVRFMVYSPNFWSCYSKFPQHKYYMISVAALATAAAGISLALWCVLIFR